MQMLVQMRLQIRQFSASIEQDDFVNCDSRNGNLVTAKQACAYAQHPRPGGPRRAGFAGFASHVKLRPNRGETATSLPTRIASADSYALAGNAITSACFVATGAKVTRCACAMLCSRLK
jgi:hypothetical protein